MAVPGAQPGDARGVLPQPAAGRQVCSQRDFHVSSYKAAQSKGRSPRDNPPGASEPTPAHLSPTSGSPRQASAPAHLFPAMVIRIKTAMKSPEPGESTSNTSGGRRSFTFNLHKKKQKKRAGKEDPAEQPGWASYISHLSLILPPPSLFFHFLF